MVNDDDPTPPRQLEPYTLRELAAADRMIELSTQFDLLQTHLVVRISHLEESFRELSQKLHMLQVSFDILNDRISVKEAT